MTKEKVVLAFVATLIGLFVAGGAFYLYQKGRVVPSEKIKIISINKPTPTPKTSVFLTLTSPADEEVTNQRVINISGKTASEAMVAILTQGNEQVIMPARDGSFQATVNIDNGQNIIEVTSIMPNGEETSITRVVTYSTEEF